MAKKYPKSESTENSVLSNENAYITWGDDLDSKQKALDQTAGCLDEYGLYRSTAGYSGRINNFSNILPNISSRPGLTRGGYDYFRYDEAVPNHIKEIIRRADDIYQKVGLVKNVIDLMGDFAVQGIKLVCKNKKTERFYRKWFKKINGKERSERFLNNLYKTGNIVINRQTAKISLKTTENFFRTSAAPDTTENDIDIVNVEKREIPWRYTFIDPVYVHVSAGSLSSFVGQKRYELVLPSNLRKIIASPKTENEKIIVSGLPSQILEAAKTKKPYPLDPEKTCVFHYKKDDWQSWAFPMIYSIMDDITVIEKLKLADMAALDGAISNIRIFKLGSLEHKIAPTKAAAAKLSSILQNNVGGGTMDLVWGPDIELIESKTTVHNFLGEGKYTPHLNSVYAGLGIPPTLTGTFGAAGTTNNFISLKTLTQRLQYGRDTLVSFWEKEIEIVQKAMGFKYAAKIEFDRMDLSNEDAEKALLIQLLDRNIISDEVVQSRFGFDPDMERTRVNREHRERKTNRTPPKSGPFYDPMIEETLKKVALQLGIVTPSQVGLDLPKKKSSEQTALEMKTVMPPKNSLSVKDSPESLKGIPQQGRPKNSKDSKQRKTKTFSPQTGAKLHIWANEAQEKISDIINPILLEFYQKKNMRSLSHEEYSEAEKIRTKLLLLSAPFSSMNEESIVKSFASLTNNSEQTYNLYLQFLNSTKNSLNRDLNVDDIKDIKSYFYSLVYDYENNGDIQ
jgi:hypothetical protein